MAIEQHHLQTYRELFIHRQDVYAQQRPSGAYFLRRESVSDDVIRSHLEGRITAGWYALSPANTVKWVCLDADREDGLAQLQQSWKQLDQRGIPSLLEASRRGGHLWILSEEIPARDARRFILGSLPDLEGVEVYPKSDALDSPKGVGSLVRGPLGVHLLSGRRYPFLDPISLQPISRSVLGTLEYLQAVPRVSASEVTDGLAALQDEPRPVAQVPIGVQGESRPGGRLSPIERLKEQIGDPYAFISQFVELDERGRGHCPLHPPDHNPSFVLDRERGHLTCFHEVDPRTGKYLGGDAIEFYRRLRGLSYPDAIRELSAM